MNFVKYAFIYVNYHCEDSIRCSINSLVTRLKSKYAYEVIVVDNSSTYNYSTCANEKIIKNVNKGFGAGVNLAVKNTMANTMVISNPDIVLRGVFNIDDFLPPQYKIHGFKVLPEDYNFIGTLPTLADFPKDIAKLILQCFGAALYEKVRASYFSYCKPDDSFGSHNNVEQIPGCFFLINKKDFVAVGGYDEKFFLYFEDTDFFRRCFSLGLIVSCFRTQVIFHETKSDAQKLSGKVRIYYTKSLLRYYFRLLSGYYRRIQRISIV